VALLRREKETRVHRQYAQLLERHRPLQSPSKPRLAPAPLDRVPVPLDRATHTALVSDAADLTRLCELREGDIPTGTCCDIIPR
jgi:hypothetical protein